MGFFNGLLEIGLSAAANSIAKNAAENFSKQNPKAMSFAMGILYYLYLTSIEEDYGADFNVSPEQAKDFDARGMYNVLISCDKSFEGADLQKILSYAVIKLAIKEDNTHLDNKELPRIIKEMRDYMIQNAGRETCIKVYIFMLKMYFSTYITISTERTIRLYLFKKSLKLTTRELLEVAEEMQEQFSWYAYETKEKLNEINRIALHDLKQILPEYRNIPSDIYQNTPEIYLDYKNEREDNFDDLYSVVKNENNKKIAEMEIKILTFLFGRRKRISDEEKEVIESMTKQDAADIDIREKIHKVHSKISRLKNSEDFFTNNEFDKLDKDTKCLLFVYSFTSIAGLIEKFSEKSDGQKISPMCIYNLYLIQKNLGITYKDRMECFKILSEREGELSQDEILNIYDALLSDKSIAHITANYPEVLDGYPLDFKVDLEEVFQNLVNQLGDKSNLVYLAYNSPEKLALVAKGYAKNATTDEKPLLIYNNSLSENCKSGFLLTDKHVYAKNSFSFSNICLNISDLNEISPKLGFLNSSILFNKKEIETEQIGQDGTELLCEFLNFCLKNLKSAKDIKISTFEEIFQ